MAPIVMGLLVSTGWLLSASHNNMATDWKLCLLTALSALAVMRTSVHLLWLIVAGGILGAAGLL